MNQDRTGKSSFKIVDDLEHGRYSWSKIGILAGASRSAVWPATIVQKNNLNILSCYDLLCVMIYVFVTYVCMH